MRAIKRIIWHCSATREGVDVSVETIRSWHKTRGFNDIGYHFVILLDGSVREGRPVELAGAHVEHHNLDSIGICYVGGIDAHGKPKDTRTPAQTATLYRLTKELIERFSGCTVHGHNDFAAKACPSFDAKNDWLEHLADGPSVDMEPIELPRPVLRRGATRMTGPPQSDPPIPPKAGTE